MKLLSHFTLLAAFALSAVSVRAADGTKKNVLLLAGKASHGPGEHEHNAGMLLFKKCLDESGLPVTATAHLSAEWPSAEELAKADTIVFYSDGGGGHFLLKDDRLAQVEKEMKRGAGFVALHYAVEYPADKGGPQALDWMGGFFEANWSVNPHWQADFTALPKHPVSNGVKPFSTNDEWYFHMRFAGADKGRLTHVLAAIAPDSTMSRKDGPHSGNPAAREAVAAKKPQTTAWAFERANGGRGFGFTGGHFHKGWGNDDQRKLVLNAIVWTAKGEVPPEGVPSKVTAEDLQKNLDPKGGNKPKPAAAAAAPASPGAKALFESPLVSSGSVAVQADLKGAKELFLVVADGGDGFEADWANWLEPVLIKADGSKVKLTDLKPKISETGWGKVETNRNAAGSAMAVKGEAVGFGFGVHAPSKIGFDLPEGIVGFAAKAGLDDGGTKQAIGSTVVFKAYAQNPGDQSVRSASPAAAGKPADARFGLDAAKAAMASFKTPDGLRATLVAAEPMIMNPTNIEVDPRGRIWATECLNYRKWMEQRPEGDRVVILEDTDGDGLADKEKTFYQSKDLTNPLGLCVLPQAKGTKVIVSAAPNVWLLTDKDGDDVAEDAKIIFKVGGVWNYDHQIHAFVFGPDGRFYFNSGNSITELKWPDGSIVKDLAGHEITNKGKPYWQGMVYRCDLDLETGVATNVETLGHNFRNNYEVAVDSFGTMWQSDNDDDGNKAVRINYVMQHGNFGYTDEMTGAGWRTKRTNIETETPLMHWYLNDPGVVPNLLQTGGGSPTGILVNEGTGLGAQFTNQLIHCDAGPRTVRAYPVENDGAGYKATMVDILTSSDNWYRPADVAIAPDGSLVVGDWYDSGVGGHNMGDNVKGKMMGRIYRVSSPGAKAAASVPDVSTAAGAAAALQSPNKPTQSLAWQALHKMGAAAEPALLDLWKNENPRMRARALGLLAQIKGRENQALTAGLKDTDANVRIAAIRLTSLLSTTRGLDTTPLENDASLVAALMQDKNPQVRREIALSLHGAKDIARLWVALAQQHDGKDRWYLEALGIGASGNEDACFDAWLAATGDKWNTPAGRDIIWRLRSAKNAAFLAKILADKSIADAEKPRYLRAFDFLPASDEKTKALVTLAGLGDMGAVAGEALARLKNVDVNANAEVKAAIEKQIASAKGTPRFIELVRDFRLKGQGPALLETALKAPQDPLAGDALKLLLADADSAKLIETALSGAQAPAVIALLGASSDRRAVTLLTGIVTSPNAGPARIEAVKALALTQPGATALVQLAKNDKLPADLKPAATTALNLVQYPALKADLAALFPMPAALGGKSLAPIAELVKTTGDIAKGKIIAERAESSCVTCHRIGDKGVDFGPALTEIGTKLPKEALYDAIINPNTGVTMGFETTQLATKDGGGAMGIVRSETSDELVLALPGGATNKFAKNQIAKREKLATSLMPSGLNQALSQQDLIDMVEYLASLKKK